jgi:hypothetical protein
MMEAPNAGLENNLAGSIASLCGKIDLIQNHHRALNCMQWNQ